MRVAIMQPYFLPYIGYWQLIAAADQFVVLDDVHFIKRGWINRNQIAVDNKPMWLTLPLDKASQNKLIHEITILDDDGWKKRMEKTIRYTYYKSPSFSAVAAVLTELLQQAEGNLSAYLSEMISIISSMLEISTVIVPTSRIFPKRGLSGQERVLDICKQLGATQYINPPGGKALYDPGRFLAEGIRLNFLEAPTKTNLRAGLDNGKPLSILDTLMYNSPNDIRRVVAEFKISNESHDD
jgi:hypothetical protein